MSQHELRLYDRSRVTTDWTCPRKRFWNYEYQGKGIVKDKLGLELFMGSCLHDALAAIAAQHPSVDIDTIATAARVAMVDSLTGEDEDSKVYAHEQGALVEGLLRGFYRHVWPRLMRDYPTILFVEEEMTYLHGGLTFMSKPDLVLQAADGRTVYIEYKSTSSKKDTWINSWNTAVQLHSTIRAVEQSKGVQVDEVVIQGLYKGYECLVPETPVLTSDLRWVPVGTLKEGDKIAGFEDLPVHHISGNPKLRQWSTATVLNVGRIIRPGYSLTFDDGTKVVCSATHKWLAAGRQGGSGAAFWVESKDLVPWTNNWRKGHRILKVIEPWAMQDVSTNTYKAGYLAAAFDGEGHLCQHQTNKGYWLTHLGFSQKKNEMLAQVEQFLADSGITLHNAGRTEPHRVEGRVVYGKSVLMRLLGMIRPVRLLPKFSFDKLGGMAPCKHPIKLVAKEFVGNIEVISLETSTGTLVANGLASHNSYNKQNSPFCYAYLRQGNPPFSHTDTLYEYKAGYKRSPTWQLEGGVKQWVERMPENILSDQFPCSPPIYIKDEMVAAFFLQREVREKEIDLAMQLLDIPGAEEYTGEVLNTAFPQKFEACSPAWGRGCEYKQLCFGEVEDPLTQGFQWRAAHHLLEEEQFHAKQGVPEGT